MTPSLDLADYTHEKLIARGYERITWPDYPGWVTYVRPGSGLFGGTEEYPYIGFAGNDATMNNWIEKVSHWKVRHPIIYKWWCDPKQKIIYYSATHEIIIKGEDPMLVENDQAA